MFIEYPYNTYFAIN